MKASLAETPGAATPAPAARGRHLVSALIGLAVSVSLLAWAFKGVRLDEIVTHLREARPLPLLAAVAIATGTFVLRMLRWRLLIRRDDGSPVAWSALWHGVAIGFMANNILPFRAGEVVRSYTAARLGGTRFTAAFSSVAVERIFDGLVVVLLLAIALFSPGLSPTLSVAGVSVSHAATIAGILCVAALGAAGAVVAWPLASERLVRRLVPSRSLAERLVALIEGVRHGLAVLRSPARLAGVVAWSLVLWTVNAAAFYVAFRAFDIPVDFAGALLLQGLLVFGIAAPSTPGFVGVFEAVIVASLALYGIDKGLASSYAATYHITTFIPITLLGAWSLIRTPIALSDLRHPPAEPLPPAPDAPPA